MTMKKFFITMMLALTTLSMIAEATARPLGGKRSFGRQSQPVKQMQAPAPAPAAPAIQRQSAQPGAAGTAGAMQQKKPSMWKGILGGALLGLGLGALLSHLGIGGALASVISAVLMIGLLALAVLFIVRMLRRKDTPANTSFPRGFNQTATAGVTPDIGSGLNRPSAFQGGTPEIGAKIGGGVGLDKPVANAQANTHAQWGVPGSFDTEAFLRHAKSSFIRMQAAWDKGDVHDLREFTTPEVFAELKMQIQERNGVADFTDVVSIDAQLLGIETTANDYLASVQFNGMIRNAPGAPAEPFVEVWNMSKPLWGSGGWVLAGIQQLP